MTWTECVLDASLGYEHGLFCFSPINGDLDGEFSIVTGLMMFSDKPPDHWKLVGIVHEGGQEAVEDFCSRYETELAGLDNGQ